MIRPLLILGWHNVEGTWCFRSRPGAGEAGLRHQLNIVARAANIISLPDAVNAMENGRPLPRRAVALTFDDGYRDNLELAVPMLERLGVPATFFLAPEMVSRRTLPWWEELGWAFEQATVTSLCWEGRSFRLTPRTRRAGYDEVSAALKLRDEAARRTALAVLIHQLRPQSPLPPTPILNWTEARDLVRRGFTIGSHSLRHSILAQETPVTQREDLAASRRLLEAETGAGVDLLAYPSGTAQDYRPDTVAAARAAGFRAALTTIKGWNTPGAPMFELRRFMLYPEWGAKGLGVLPRQVVRHLRFRLHLAASVSR